MSKEWDFASKGIEISFGKFMLEHYPLLNVQTGVVSDEDTAEIWEAVKKEAIEKVRGNKNRSAKIFLTQQTRRLGGKQEDEEIVLFEFKRTVLQTADSSESYYQDMREVADKQHTPILTGLKALAADRDWNVEVVPLVVGQRSVKVKERLSLRYHARPLVRRINPYMKRS